MRISGIAKRPRFAGRLRQQRTLLLVQPLE
jgi:hypothetical protein